MRALRAGVWGSGGWRSASQLLVCLQLAPAVFPDNCSHCCCAYGHHGVHLAAGAWRAGLGRRGVPMLPPPSPPCRRHRKGGRSAASWARGGGRTLGEGETEKKGTRAPARAHRARASSRRNTPRCRTRELTIRMPASQVSPPPALSPWLELGANLCTAC